MALHGSLSRVRSRGNRTISLLSAQRAQDLSSLPSGRLLGVNGGATPQSKDRARGPCRMPPAGIFSAKRNITLLSSFPKYSGGLGVEPPRPAWPERKSDPRGAATHSERADLTARLGRVPEQVEHILRDRTEADNLNGLLVRHPQRRRHLRH